MGSAEGSITLRMTLHRPAPKLTAARISSGSAWRTPVYVLIAAQSGIGYLILNAQNLMETTKLMVGIVLLSLLGLASHWLLVRLERAALPWKPEA